MVPFHFSSRFPGLTAHHRSAPWPVCQPSDPFSLDARFAEVGDVCPFNVVADNGPTFGAPFLAPLGLLLLDTKSAEVRYPFPTHVVANAGATSGARLLLPIRFFLISACLAEIWRCTLTLRAPHSSAYHR